VLKGNGNFALTELKTDVILHSGGRTHSGRLGKMPSAIWKLRQPGITRESTFIFAMSSMATRRLIGNRGPRAPSPTGPSFSRLPRYPPPRADQLKFTLRFGVYARHNLGHFRLSVSGGPVAFEREEKRLAGLNPWLKLAAAYGLNGRNDKAAEYFSKALQADPNFGDDRQTQHRYDAARAAALAAAGGGKDEPPQGDRAKAKLRGRPSTG